MRRPSPFPSYKWRQHEFIAIAQITIMFNSIAFYGNYGNNNNSYCVSLDTRSRARVDRARDPLFEFVSDEALSRPTYKTFISLLDNYETSTGRAGDTLKKCLLSNLFCF